MLSQLKRRSLNKNHLVRIINGVLILLCVPVFIFAQDIQASFQEANTAYRNEDYTSAINLYNGLINQGYTSSKLNYNLGTAYLKVDSIALANLYLERALKQAPFDDRIQGNLSLARSKVETDIYEVPQFILKRFWDVWTNILSPNGWVIVQVLILMLILIIVYYWQFKSTGILRRRLGLMSLFLVVVIGIMFLSGTYAAYQMRAQNSGIVMFEHQLLSGPDERAPIIQEISSGVKVIILDEVDEWLRVELLNKEAGWIEENSIVRI